MDIWSILGIQPTEDKDKLKKIYRIKLADVNPEDDPKGFMELRHAYEEAVRLADEHASADAEDKDNKESPLLKVIKELYQDFPTRIDREAWDELFNRDEFVALDTAEDSFNILMAFLMDNFYLPQKIWKVIVELFDIEDRKKELSERYPEDFIDYIISNSEYDDIINYYLFDGNSDEFDAYIEKYYRLDAAVRKHDLENQDKYIEEIEKLDVYHPYLEVCKIRHRIQIMSTDEQGTETPVAVEYADELNKLQEKADELMAEYPEDIFFLNSCGDVAMVREDYALAEKYYDKSFALAPDNYMVKGKQAELKFHLGEYEKSRDMYMDLLMINHYDNNVRAGMIRANQGFIDTLKKKLDENPEDNNSRLEMAWCLYHSYRFDEAIKVLNEFEPDDEKKCEYNNVKGRTYLCLSEYDNALSCFEIWKSEIEKISADDMSKESTDKKKRYEYVNFLIADCHLKTKRYKQAREYLDIAMAKEHEEIILSYEAKCELEYESECYAECIRSCEELLDRDNRSFIGYNYMAKSSYMLDYYKEAMNACEHAISIYPYVPDPYALEIKIYIQVNQLDGAKRTVERYRAFGIDSDNIDINEARILEKEGKHQEAVELLTGTMERRGPEDTDLEDYCELYNVLAFNCERLGGEYLAKAEELYNKVIALEPKHISAYGRLGILYKNMGRYDEALDMLTRQLEINPHPFYYIHRGIINRYLSNFKSALCDYQEALKYEPDNTYCYTHIGMIYELHREFDKALENYDNALKYMDGENDKKKKAGVYSCKARTLQCLNRFEESRQLYEKYFEEFGLDADVAYDYAALLQRMNLVDDAAAILRKCIDNLEYSEVVQACIRQLCAVYGEEGYIDMANECFRLAISKDENDERAYSTMAKVFKDHGLMDDARKLYEEAVRLDADNNENYYSELIEAIVSKRTLFKPDIRLYVEKAIVKVDSKDNPRNYIKMSRLNRSLKKPKVAMEIIDRGLKVKRCAGCFYGKCHEAMYEKGLIYEYMKDYDMARMCYTEALKICGHNAVYEERLKRIEGK